MTNWQTKKLGDVAEITKGKSLSKNDIIDDGKNECIHYGELFTKYSEIIKKVESRTNLSNNVFLSRANDVLMPTSDVTPRGLATASYLPFNNVVIGGDVLVIRPKVDELDGRFFAYYVYADKHAILRLTTGSTIFHLYGSDMRKLNLSLPEKSEQERIVGVLEVWDEYIEKLEQKIALKEQLKKGLMQQLLTGKRRLPGFSDEWQMVPVGSIASITMGQSPSSSSYNDMGDGMVLVQGNADMKNGKTIERIWTTEITKKAPINSLIMTVRAPVGEIAVSNQEVCLGRGVCSISSAYSEYLRIYLTWFKPRWSKLIQGSTFESVNGSDIRNLKISIPGEKEANTIADTFKSAEANIELLRLVKESATQQKKYLLKNLITGTIRTPEDLKPLDTTRLERSAL